jgi:hypothetical protein
MAAPGERSATTGHFVGAMAMYKTEKFGVGLGYNARENEVGQKSLQSTSLGGSLVLGPGTAFAQVVQIKDENPSGLSTLSASLTPSFGGFAPTIANAFVQALKQDAQVNHIGYRLTTGPHIVYVAYTTLSDKLRDADTASYGAAYTYSLSKRTAINAAATHFNNKGLAQAAPGQAGFLGGVTASAGTDSNSFAVGIRHSF